MIKLDRASSLFWFLIGLFFSIHAYKIGIGEFRKPGPGFVFFLAGIMLSALSAINLLNTFFAREKDSETPEKLFSGIKWGKVVIVIIVLFACVYSFNLLGFPLTTFFLMIFLFRIIEPMKWWVVIFAAILTISAVYVVFTLWMGVPFPKGIMGI